MYDACLRFLAQDVSSTSVVFLQLDNYSKRVQYGSLRANVVATLKRPVPPFWVLSALPLRILKDGEDPVTLASVSEAIVENVASLVENKSGPRPNPFPRNESGPIESFHTDQIGPNWFDYLTLINLDSGIASSEVRAVVTNIGGFGRVGCGGSSEWLYFLDGDNEEFPREHSHKDKRTMDSGGMDAAVNG
ncbi:hypothetical protein PIB30_079047 [Stylosanthes scabra]|uniref:Uncharacterized protein n=1 Tax=Stylosanthes scabra TaxID=79078 RepID=A0ABU6SRY0_9FABA|nr:hypothetical protein [Stylosanthes scabra]